MAPVPSWLSTDWILAAFAERKGNAQAAYAQFVADGKNQPSPWQSLKNQIYLGSDAFVEQMQDKVEAGRHLSERG
ncbi:MAG: addiction module toxin RelE, partial [Gammaproteobacteria bacterium]|nr:addiction module toxin RelE [Gammaproteobacteria bacterium]MBU1655290.1 addiction module toxin RelE [Gammaproteobacteria bacterium]